MKSNKIKLKSKNYKIYLRSKNQEETNIEVISHPRLSGDRQLRVKAVLNTPQIVNY